MVVTDAYGSVKTFQRPSYFHLDWRPPALDAGGMETPNNNRPWQRYLRISLRGLIALVLVIGAGLAWMVRNARDQRSAVVAIHQVGGTVVYDWQLNNGIPIPNGKPWAPKWLVERIGVKLLQPRHSGRPRQPGFRCGARPHRASEPA